MAESGNGRGTTTSAAIFSTLDKTAFCSQTPTKKLWNDLRSTVREGVSNNPKSVNVDSTTERFTVLTGWSASS